MNKLLHSTNNYCNFIQRIERENKCVSGRNKCYLFNRKKKKAGWQINQTKAFLTGGTKHIPQNSLHLCIFEHNENSQKVPH